MVLTGADQQGRAKRLPYAGGVSEPAQVSLVDQAYDELRGRILRCDLAPGSQVTERALSAELGFGLAAVRGALARLAADSLVVSVPRVGYQVAPITLRSVNDFFEAWEIIGPAILRLAVKRLHPGERDRIAAVDPPARNATPEQLVDYATAAWDVIVEAAANSVLTDLYRRLSNDMHRIYILVLRSETHSVMQALSIPSLMSESPEEAERVAREYIRESRARVIEWILDSTSLADTSVRFGLN